MYIENGRCTFEGSQTNACFGITCRLYVKLPYWLLIESVPSVTWLLPNLVIHLS